MEAVKLLALAGLCLAGCSDATFNADDARNYFAKDFVSTQPQACTTGDVDLTNSEVATFFSRARKLSYRQLTDNYPEAPCHLLGTVQYGDRTCDWSVSAAGTGELRCAETVWYFACDDCEDLLTKP
jgi:hypothetical protein